MKKEINVILLGVLKNRTEEEEKYLNNIIREELDWCFIAGQLMHHRLGGYFITGLTNDMNAYLFPEFKKTLEILVKVQNRINIETLEELQPIFKKIHNEGINYAALKGLIYNMSIYETGVRRSNDSDILVLEEDLEKLDSILRNEGFIQSNDCGVTEAGRKDKIIQRINHHDLVPYYKNCKSEFLERIKLDINFHFDNKENDITKRIFEYGTILHEKNLFEIRGLKLETHFAHLCVHFHREASNSIWTSARRDILLYKLIDVVNTYRVFKQEDIIKWCKLMKELKLENQAYFTLYYMNVFYPNMNLNNVMMNFDVGDDDFVQNIRILGSNAVKKREESFFEHTFNLKFSQNFEERDFKRVF